MPARTTSPGSIATVGRVGDMDLETRLELAARGGSFRCPRRLETFYQLQFLHVN